MDVLLKIKNIAAEQFNEDVNKIGPETDIISDMGSDSIEAVDFIIRIEEAFGIEIPDEDVPKLTKIDTLCRYVQNKISPS
jgi:acyl carrier protein